MLCSECLKGKKERVLGNGITEPPYLLLIRCLTITSITNIQMTSAA